MMRTFFHILFGAVAFAFVVAAPPPVSAAEDGISVEIRSIAASKSDEGVDEDLSDLKSKLEKVFGDYSTFEQLTKVSFDLDRGQSKSITLPEGSKISVTFHGPAGDLLKLGLEISGKLSTSLRASPGSTFFQAGLEYKSGILILAITVEGN